MKTSVFLSGKGKSQIRNFKEVGPVEMPLFHSERPKDATTFLETVFFAKALKFVRGSIWIAARCKYRLLLLGQPCELISGTSCINQSQLC
jgi:hypothetical protein